MAINTENLVGKGGGVVKKALAATFLAAALAVPVVVGAATAEDRVTPGRTIEAFLGTNLIDLQNYPANRLITVDVLRNGVVVSTVTAKTDAEGFVEFNHVGGGQVSEGGDCFKPPVSPDVMPGDVIRARAAGDPGGVFDTATVRDLSVDFESITVNRVANPNTITVSGRVASTEAAPIVPGTDVLELRLNKGTRDNRWETGPGLDQERANRRDLRVDIGEDLTNDGDGDPTTFTRVLRVSNDDANDWESNPGEVALEWSVGAAGAEAEEAAPPAIFVADGAEAEGLPGCPPFAENALTSSNPKVLNKANVGKGIRLAGISRDAAGPITVTLDDQDADSADAISLTATPQPAYIDGHQTWRTGAMTPEQLQQLGALGDGRLTASASIGGSNLSILKDTVAPSRAPTATPRAGVYRRTQLVTLDAQPGTTVRYTLDGSRPTRNSRIAARTIRVASTTTIKAIAVDRAGNIGPLGTHRFVIRRAR